MAWRLNEEEEEGDAGGDDEEGVQFAEAPFEPRLPRRLLASKLGALETRSEQLNGKANGPRKGIAQQKLENKNKDLRVASEHTSRKLYFSLVSGGHEIEKAKREVQEAEEELQRKKDAAVKNKQGKTLKRERKVG